MAYDFATTLDGSFFVQDNSVELPSDDELLANESSKWSIGLSKSNDLLLLREQGQSSVRALQLCKSHQRYDVETNTCLTCEPNLENFDASAS